MRKMFSYACASLLAASFSQIAFSQSVTVNPETGNSDNPTSQSARSSDSNSMSGNSGGTEGSAATGAGGDDKPREHPGKGWAKGHELGKGQGVNDERHGGRHSGSAASGSSNQY